jgi:carboxymethylenebutenolidase
MNISPPSTCRPSSAAAAAGKAAVFLLALAYGPGTPAQPPSKPSPPGKLPPFLDEFRARNEPAVLSREVCFPSATGTVRGYLARQDTREALPAVLLIHDQAGPSDWIKQSARELASIGYVVLALDLGKRVPASGKSPGPAAALADEPTLADLSAAVRWLRRRPDVLPERIGVVGWSWGADQALALAAATPLQACVVCYGTLADDAALFAGLRTTPLLVIVAGKERSLPAFRKALEAARIHHRIRVYEDVSQGFMTPRPGKQHAHAETEQAWVEIYNFLGKYVEDAPDNGPAFAGAAKSSPRDSAAATIADIMRAVNEPTGVRGALIRALEKKPGGPQEWESVRAHAALIAEAGALLEHRRPRKGAHAHWLHEARAYTAAARAVVAAADRQDYEGARHALGALGERCAACHKQHR